VAVKIVADLFEAGGFEPVGLVEDEQSSATSFRFRTDRPRRSSLVTTSVSPSRK
jgi:hypothetical protein